MMMADGELAKIGRTEEVLEVVASHGDRCMDFIWKNKGPLAVGATLTAFLANPEAFFNTAQGVTKTVAENVVRPLADIPGTAVKAVAEGTNWTVVFVAALVGGVGIWAGRVWLRRNLNRNTRDQTSNQRRAFDLQFPGARARMEVRIKKEELRDARVCCYWLVRVLRSELREEEPRAGRDNSQARG